MGLGRSHLKQGPKESHGIDGDRRRLSKVWIMRLHAYDYWFLLFAF
jgi:hypothetical protein